MTTVDVDFREASHDIVIAQVPLAHLSIEVGHLHREDLYSDEKLRAQFGRTRRWIDTAVDDLKARLGTTARVSTCFLVDDYAPNGARGAPPPRETVDMLLATAKAQGVPLDYIVRESGCVMSADTARTSDIDRVGLAEIVAARLIAEPDEGDNGWRPPTSVTGWLSNGRRSPGGSDSAAMAQPVWVPPKEHGARNHSVFLDVELWRVPEGRRGDSQTIDDREWSCAFLATVWQLLRLGLLRDEGRAVAAAFEWTGGPDTWPEDWANMPTVLKVNKQAQPFAAYRAISLMPPDYLEIEHAVRVLMRHFSYDDKVLEQIRARAAREKASLPAPMDRLSYVFIDSE